MQKKLFHSELLAITKMITISENYHDNYKNIYPDKIYLDVVPCVANFNIKN